MLSKRLLIANAYELRIKLLLTRDKTIIKINEVIAKPNQPLQVLLYRRFC